jgi:D-alanyl-D-alanine carboxypeptidase
MTACPETSVASTFVLYIDLNYQNMRKSFLFFLLLVPSIISAQGKKQRLQFVLDSLQSTGNYPGLSLAYVLKNDNTVAISSGYADKEKQIPMQPSAMLMQGSVGKTYVAAIALQFIKEGKLSLDDKVSKWLGNQSWYSRIPNAEDITVRMIMNHTSGVMRYEFKEAFTEDLSNQPDKIWNADELLKYVLDEKASFKAGESWEYSDTNYILLGLILEKISGKKYYDLLRQRILNPLNLKNTKPSDQRKLNGLVQGYAGANNEFGNKDRVISEDGKFIINPQFEWTGGGIYSTTSDLAKWGKLLYAGKVLDSSSMKLMLDAVPAKLGRDTKYGLGVIVRPTALGISYGHSGFFPGYMTEMLYFPEKNLCIAIQSNSSDFRQLKIPLLRCLMLMANETLKEN